MVKNSPAIQEMQTRFLGWEDPLEKEMGTHSSILAWRIPRTEEPGRLQSMWSHRVGHDGATNTFNSFLHLSTIDILDRIHLHRGWGVHPGTVRSTPTPLVTTKTVSRHCPFPRGAKPPPVENCCMKAI